MMFCFLLPDCFDYLKAISSAALAVKLDTTGLHGFPQPRCGGLDFRPILGG
jgi:hypothetical protein